MTMQASYLRRRREIEDYFDRTALDAWKKLTGTDKVSAIRATVRAGRQRMRETILSRFPEDLRGWRMLDAGCGAGDMAIALAHRGADVVAVDLSAEMVRHASQNALGRTAPGSIRFASGDMLAAQWGRFDGVVAMDSIIHYQSEDALAAIATLAERTDARIVFTIAPRTLALSLMHAFGRLLPRSDRAPAIVPLSTGALLRGLCARPGMERWRAESVGRVNSGFYISEALEVTRP